MQTRVFLTAAACLAAMLPLAGPAGAQGIVPQPGAITSPIPPPAAVTIRATITALNPQTRVVTLTGAAGNAVTLTAGPLVRLQLLHVGDTVIARYLRSIAFLVSGPGQAAPANDVAAALARKVDGPGGAVVAVTNVSATVVGIDLAAHSLDVVDPSGGGVRTILVTDPERIQMLDQLKIGDTVTAVISEELAVAIDPAT